jgi:hypothetical protein
MRLKVGVVLVVMTEFRRSWSSWHTIGTLDWGEPLAGAAFKHDPTPNAAPVRSSIGITYGHGRVAEQKKEPRSYS